MRKKLTLSFILIFAVCLLIIICRFLFIAEKPLLNQVKFYEGGVYGLELDPYYDEAENTYYLFIPAYASIEDMKIECAEFIKCDFSENSVDFGNDMADLPLSEDITLTITNFYQKETYNFQIWKCDNLPTVYIETETGSMDSINADKDYKEDASVLIVNADGSQEFSGMSTLSGRGNTSWRGVDNKGVAKKPYNITFDNPVSLLGFTNTEQYALMSNYADTSALRNPTVYYAARECGIDYTSDMQYVLVYFNGQFNGLYTICTKDTYQQDTDNIKAVFEITLSSRDNSDLITDAGDEIRVYYGENDYVKEKLDQFERMLSENVDYDVLAQYVDMRSFADKYILEELFLNSDSSLLSQYFYIDNQGVIHTMNAWDYDRALGLIRTFSHSPTNMLILKTSPTGGKWYKSLYQYAEFQQLVREEFTEIFSENYIEKVFSSIEESAVAISSSWEADKLRWKSERPYWNDGQNRDFDTLGEYVDFLENFLSERYDFLKSYFYAPEQFYTVNLEVEIGSSTTRINLNYEDGEQAILPQYLLDYSYPNYTFGGWFTETGEKYDDIKIMENVTLLADLEKVTDGEATATDLSSDSSETEVIEQSDGNYAIALLKRIYHFFGLDSFGRKRIALCGVFAIFFVALIVTEAVRCSRERKAEK